jgi:deoxyribose-phosphate aldolase
MGGAPVTDRKVARRILALLDLTDLSDDCSAEAVQRLCARAVGSAGSVAAVCVWPRFVPQARHELADTGVRVATVVNFPAGGDDVDPVVADTQAALADGADEIDVVLPYRAMLRGEPEVAVSLVRAVASCLGPDHRLKVILETGELPDQSAVATASRLAIQGGADFLKTSTGKTPVSATLEAAATMLGVIRDSDQPVGLKPSGGIRTLDDARAYLDLADRVMGPRWATPTTFRFGASGLLDVLIAAIEGHPSTGLPRAEGY